MHLLDLGFISYCKFESKKVCIINNENNSRNVHFLFKFRAYNEADIPQKLFF